MVELSQQSCEACRADAPRISEAELKTLMSEIPDWSPVVVDNIMRLTREFSFKNFEQAMAFSNGVGDIAEAEGHHPAILTEWGKVGSWQNYTKIRWNIHKLTKCGAPGPVRTGNLRLRRASRYPIVPRGLCGGIVAGAFIPGNNNRTLPADFA